MARALHLRQTIDVKKDTNSWFVRGVMLIERMVEFLGLLLGLP